jgi:metal-dependent HD superfamily phosphatase/phosphodiesterase
MAFEVPVRKNARLKQVLERITSDAELLQLWRCANINAVDRSGISDHGEIHIRIVANAALKILRLLVEGGIEPSIVTHHKMTAEDAEVVVTLAACLHDTGISVHRDDHEKYSLFIAFRKARDLLTGVYEEPALTTMVSEVLHAIIAHDADQKCLTIEAGAVKVADATDMTHGRSRIPFQAGQVNIHSVSAQAVADVKIEKGTDRPVRISVKLHNSAGIYQLDNLLKHKLKNSTIAPHVEVEARIESETEKRLFEVYKM